MKRVIPLVFAWLCLGSLTATAGPFSYTPPTRPFGPAHVGYTGDPRQCMNHLPPFVAAFFGGALCVETLAAQEFVMVWDLPARTDIDGYLVYRNADLSIPIRYVSGRDFTTVAIPGAAYGDCYRVSTIFTGGEESLHSNMTCVPWNWQPLQHLSTPFVARQYWSGEAHNAPGNYVLPRTPTSDTILLGNRNFHREYGFFTQYRWEYSRGHWQWPALDSVVGSAVIYNATARLVENNWGCGDYELAAADAPPGSGAMPWGTSLGVMPYTGAHGGRTHSWAIDITDFARGWSEGWLDNNGLIVRTRREGGSGDDFFCASSPFMSLDLTYFPYP